MFYRYLLTFLTALYFVHPAFAMQKKEVEKYINTQNDGSMVTTIEPLGKKPNIFDKDSIAEWISKKQLKAFIGEDVKDLEGYDIFSEKALEALLETKIVKVKIKSENRDRLFTSIDLRSFGNFLLKNDPAVKVLKKAVYINHAYIAKKQNDTAETFEAKKIPPFKPVSLYIASIREKLRSAIYSKNPNLQAVNQLLVTPEFVLSNANREEGEASNRILEALLHLPMVKLTGKQNPIIDLSHLREAILTFDPVILKLIQIQDLQETIVKNADSVTSSNMKKYYSLIEPFLEEKIIINNKAATLSLDEINQTPATENLPTSKQDYFLNDKSLDETHYQISGNGPTQNEMQSDKLSLLSLDETSQSPAMNNLPVYMLESFAGKDSLDQTDYIISLDQTTQTPAVSNLPIYEQKHFSNLDSIDQIQTTRLTATPKSHFADMISFVHKTIKRNQKIESPKNNQTNEAPTIDEAYIPNNDIILPRTIPQAPIVVPNGANTQTELAAREATNEQIKKDAKIWERIEPYMAIGICASLYTLYSSKADIKNLYSYFSSFSKK